MVVLVNNLKIDKLCLYDNKTHETMKHIRLRNAKHPLNFIN